MFHVNAAAEGVIVDLIQKIVGEDGPATKVTLKLLPTEARLVKDALENYGVACLAAGRDKLARGEDPKALVSRAHGAALLSVRIDEEVEAVCQGLESFLERRCAEAGEESCLTAVAA